MKLFRIYQDVNRGYDTYDSAIVAAHDEDMARCIHPGGSYRWDGTHWSVTNPSGHVSRESEWSPTWAAPQRVGVKLIGEASPDTEAGVICASFNAG